MSFIKQCHLRLCLEYFSYFILILAFGIMIYYAYMSFYPFEVIRFTQTDNSGNGIYRVITPKVKAGGTLQYESSFTKYMNYIGEMSCYFEDGIVYQLTDRVNNNSLGDHSEIRQIDVPASLEPERYRYGCTVRYHLTMGRIIEYKFYTDYFEVVE